MSNSLNHRKDRITSERQVNPGADTQPSAASSCQTNQYNTAQLRAAGKYQYASYRQLQTVVSPVTGHVNNKWNRTQLHLTCMDGWDISSLQRVAYLAAALRDRHAAAMLLLSVSR